MAEAIRYSWIVRHVSGFTRSVEILFGIIWLIDGQFKFWPGFASQFSELIAQAALNQPKWLAPWFGFWSAATAPHPYFWVYIIGISELAVAFALISGTARKLAYMLGAVLSLLIWAVPEGFGGPYGPGSTDVGTAVIYAVVFLLLLGYIASIDGHQRYTLDAFINKRIKWWHKIADFS